MPGQNIFVSHFRIGDPSEAYALLGICLQWSLWSRQTKDRPRVDDRIGTPFTMCALKIDGTKKGPFTRVVCGSATHFPVDGTTNPPSRSLKTEPLCSISSETVFTQRPPSLSDRRAVKSADHPQHMLSLSLPTCKMVDAMRPMGKPMDIEYQIGGLVQSPFFLEGRVV